MSAEKQAATTTVEVGPVNGVGRFEWNLELFERFGHCHLAWHTDSPFRAQQGRLCLYAGTFPSDPTQAVAWCWDDVSQPQPFDTGKTWGAGWCAAYIAQANPNGPYVYFAKTDVTTP